MLEIITLEEEIIITKYFLNQKNTGVFLSSELETNINSSKQKRKEKNNIRRLYWLTIEEYKNMLEEKILKEKIILLGYSIESVLLEQNYTLRKRELKSILEYFKKKGKKEIYVVEKIIIYGPAGIRTPDLQLRRLSPYPD